MAAARFHPLRGHLQLCRAAIVGLIFLVEVAASLWLPMVGAGDRGADPQAAAELAVRKRILANWQARQDRIKSFYVAWKAEPIDRPPKWAKVGLGGVHQLWVGSDGRFRDEFPKFEFGGSLLVAQQQRSFDGKSLWMLWTPLKFAGPGGTFEKIPAGWFPAGGIGPRKGLEYGPGNPEVLAFRPLKSPWADWTLENSRVTSQNAVVERLHYVKIQKSDAKTGMIEACWVDPRRDDVVIHFAREYTSGSEDWISFEYKQDPRHVWVPTGWQSETRDIRELGTTTGSRRPTGKAVVTECKINDDYPPGMFQIEFPPGAIVRNSYLKGDYFVRRDGSQRRIDHVLMGDALKYERLVNEDRTRPAQP